MKSPIPPRPPTPPHHPTYHVHFSAGTIKRIISTTLTDRQLSTITQLPSGKSFNNRIYFLTLQSIKRTDTPPPSTPLNAPDSELQQQEFVLKVSGRFFGPEKVENEVACLLLLEKHCPEVPAPRVLAWSDGGDVVKRVVGGWRPGKRTRGNDDMLAREREPGSGLAECEMEDIRLPYPTTDDEYPEEDNKEDDQSWILMTRRPGRLLSPQDLAGPHGNDLMRQLAGYMAKWRQQVPLSSRIGNLRHLDPTPSTAPFPHENSSNRHIYTQLSPSLPNMTISGLLYAHYIPEPPGPDNITSQLAYYRTRFHDQLTKLETEAVFAACRDEVAPLVHEFVERDMPGLDMFAGDDVDEEEEEEDNTEDVGRGRREDKFVFTHYDFSPRNILVNDSSTGQISPPPLPPPLSSATSATAGQQSSLSSSAYCPISITGILDFEFSGFFPPNEEFVNDAVANADDWPTRSYNVFLEELGRLGVKIPIREKDRGQEENQQGGGLEKKWQQEIALVRILEDVAPWWLREGGTKGQELVRELEGAKGRVERGVEALRMGGGK